MTEQPTREELADTKARAIDGDLLGPQDTHSELRVTLSATADGKRHYMQILSADGWSVNIVLIANRIDVNDVRGVSK